MRVFSRFFLRAAVATRSIPPVFRLCIAAAFKARKLERKHSPGVDDLHEYRDAEQRERIQRAIRVHYDKFNESPAYDAELEMTVPPFERTSLNGAFEVTPALRAAVREGVKKRRAEGAKGRLLVVANKTNTIVALGLGEHGDIRNLLGDVCGARIPKLREEPEPFFLTDHAPYKDWLKSRDFRTAVHKGWIELLPAALK